MRNNIRHIVYKHGYLLIIAAWLYTLSFIFTNYWSYRSSPHKVKSIFEEWIHGQEMKMNAVSVDTVFIQSLISQEEEQRIQVPKEDFGIFIYDNSVGQPSELLYWSSNKMEVPTAVIRGKNGQDFITTPHGNFIVVKKQLELKARQYLVFTVLPVQWTYFIHNKYFHTDFAAFQGLANQYEVNTEHHGETVNNIEGKYLFSIRLKDGKGFIAYDTITILLRVLAIVLMCFFFQLVAEDIVTVFNFSKGFLFLLISVLLLRLLAYWFAFPFDYSKLPLFDPAVYASNFLHPSLGDLLINSILFFWVLLFYKNYLNRTTWLERNLPFWGYSSIAVTGLTISCFTAVWIITSLVQDSKISFDVSNFFSLTVYSSVSFIILCFIALNFFYLSQIILRSVIDKRSFDLRWYAMVLLSGFLCMFLLVDLKNIQLYLWVLGWLVVYLFLLQIRKADFNTNLIKTPFFIMWVMVFALSIAALVMYQNRVVEFEQRKRIAEKLAIQTDPTGENLLQISTSHFDSTFMAADFYRFETGEFSNKYLKDSLINQHFTGYLNKFDTRIYTFDQFFQPLYNDDSLDYASIKTMVVNQAISTEVPDLYRYEKNREGYSYIYQKEIHDATSVKGYLFILLKSKRYKSEALYPELFNQSQDVLGDMNSNYAYAVYLNGKIANHFNSYDFPSKLKEKQIPDFEFSYKKAGDYTELWYNTGLNRQVVIVKRNTWLTESVTLFAYLFFAFLLIILSFYLGSQLMKTRLKWDRIQQIFRLNIRSQIQATIIFVSVFSFTVIGISTISFYIYRFNTSNKERLSKAIQVMGNELGIKLQKVLDGNEGVDLVKSKYALEGLLAEISDLRNVDVNIYKPNGDLLISTQPYIYNKHLLTEKMEPGAYAAMRFNHPIRFFQSESIGAFKYLSVYVPLLGENQRVLGYLNIPYLNSQLELNQEISGFLATLINLNAFIFLLAGAIAFFLTNRITAPLSLIASTMQKMSLGTKNEVIRWNSYDEIGILIKEYNTMVQKLEESAASLARSEREGAWREMARQVAHEIKNPLTPMKLSIQFLQKAIKEGAPNVKELSQKMSATLIEQIDQLSQIAGDFSQFANIGNANFEELDITYILDSVIQLFASDEKVDIRFIKLNEAAMVSADKIQMNRLFTNLMKNAVEAGIEFAGTARILIEMKASSNRLIITIRDQSGGITENARAKIFQPNFTTKSSGTGLGLAISKSIVEKANGQISFETIEGQGTAFSIVLPLITH